jgi:hypothetical protein
MTEIAVNPKAAINPSDFIFAELGPGQDMQARSFFSDILDAGVTIVDDFLRRDVTPDQLLARTAVEDFANSIISRNPNHEQQMQARNGLDDLIRVLSSRRDIAPDDSEHAARGNFEDFMKILNSRELAFHPPHDLTPDELAGRNTVDDIVNAYMPKHSAREPSSQRETQARSADSDAFIKAFLNSRDLSRRLTTDEVLRILASRAMDDLD